MAMVIAGEVHSFGMSGIGVSLLGCFFSRGSQLLSSRPTGVTAIVSYNARLVGWEERNMSKEGTMAPANGSSQGCLRHPAH